MGVELNGSEHVLAVELVDRGADVADDGADLNRLAANRFAHKTFFTPSVLGYPFFTWQFGVV